MALIASWGPATAMRSWPAWATAVAPKTGAAMKEAPASWTREEREVVVEGCTVVVSRIILEDIWPLEIISWITDFEAESSLTFKWVRKTYMCEKGAGGFAQIQR
jgi:hypothetical protein